MIGAGAILLQCRPRTSAVSEVPSRISMKSYLCRDKSADVIIPGLRMFSASGVFIGHNAAGRD